MNTRTIFVRTAMLVALAAVAVAVPAQERAKELPRPTTRSLIQQLGHRDYDKREEAEKQLLAQGRAARAQLERAARDHEDAEVRWRARRILQRLEREAEPGLRRQPRDQDRPHRRLGRVEDVDRLFEDIFRRLEQDLDIDIGDVRRHMERARSEARARARDLDMQSDRQSRSMKMSITPDGVRVEVEETDRDGKVHKKTYEADDMEAFKRKYPDVVKRFGIGGSGIRVFGGQLRDLEGFNLRRGYWPRLNLDLDHDLPQRIMKQLREQQRSHRQLMERLRRLDPPLTRLFEEERERFPSPRDIDRRTGDRDAPPPGERLGIYASDAPAEVARFLGLEAGQGLQVEEVVTGSLAERLGLQPGDILFQVADRKIFAVEDVREALRPIKAGDTVRVQVNRRGRVLELAAKKPEDGKRETGKEPNSNKLKQRGKLR